MAQHKATKFVLKTAQPVGFTVVTPQATRRIVTAPAQPTGRTVSAQTSRLPLRRLPHGTPAAGLTTKIALMKQPYISTQDIQLINPQVAKAVSKIQVPTDGVPRAQITVPLSPELAVTDEMLFEDAADATKKFYLPRYRVAVQNVSGQQQFRVTLEQHEQGGSLTVHLETYPAAKIDTASREAEVIEHAITVMLRYRIPGEAGGIPMEWEFEEREAAEGTLRAVLRMSSLADLTQLYQAITQDAYGATLTIRRLMQVAIPIDLGPHMRPLQNDIKKKQGTVAKLQQELASIDASLADLENRTRGPGGIRYWISYAPTTTKIEAQRAQKQKQLAALKRVIASKQTELKKLQSTPLFRIVTHTVDHIVEHRPFVFSRDLHPYVTSNVVPNAEQSFSLIRWQVAWTTQEISQSHVYFQDKAQPHVFYYLPDSFKIARRPEAPHYPLMAVRVPTPEGAVEDPNALPVTFEYTAVPCVELERLEAAAEELGAQVPEPLPAGVEGLEFRPLLVDADDLRFQIILPRTDTAAGVVQEEVLVDLRSGISHRLTLPMQAFKTVYDALFGESAVLFKGQVEVDLGNATNDGIPPIPVIARLNDMAGELFEHQQFPDAEGVNVILRNAIESPLQLHNLPVILHRGDTGVPGTMAQVSKLTDPSATALPLVLQPKEDMRLRVLPSAPLAGTEPFEAIFDLDAVEVLPDPQAVWQTIFDPSTQVQQTRTVKVEAFFTPRPNDGQIKKIIVDFELGEFVELSPENRVAEAVLQRPIGDVVLEQLDLGTYRYKRTFVVEEPQEVKFFQDEVWRTDTKDLLFPEAEFPKEQ